VRPAAIFLLAAFPAWCGVKAGDPAPPLHLQSLIPDAPVEASLEALKGKPVVLEFWATWCGPCLDSIPHLNELADQFAGRVQFISVTDEDPALIGKFLKATPLHGWVGIDRAKTMFKAYGFEGVPETVLIGADGKFAGTSIPRLLKASHLEDLLAGRPVIPPAPFPDLSIARAGDDGVPALLDMVVRPSARSGSGFTPGGTRFQAKRFTIRSLLASATHLTTDYVVGDAADDPIRYDVSLSAPGANSAAFQKLVPELLCLALHVTTRRETRDIDGWILKAPHGRPEALKPATTHSMSGMVGPGEFRPTGASMAQLVDRVRWELHKPVADQTGISDKFDIALSWDAKQPESLLEALRGIGFTVEAGVLPTEFLVVSK